LIDTADLATRPCLRLTLDNDWTLECTAETPFTLPDGTTKMADAMQGETVLLVGGDTATVTTVEDIGAQTIVKISGGGKSFAAGAMPVQLIYSHNMVKI
jgi:hypothetical protein